MNIPASQGPNHEFAAPVSKRLASKTLERNRSINFGLSQPPADQFRLRFAGSKNIDTPDERIPEIEPAKTAVDRVKKSPEDFFRQLSLMEQVNEDLRQQIYQDLRTRHMGFWRGNLEGFGKGIAGAFNVVTSLLPAYSMYGMRHLINTFEPLPSPITKQDVQNTVEYARTVSEYRKGKILTPFSRVSNPAFLEKEIGRHPVFQNLALALERFGNQGELSLKELDALIDRLEKHPQSFASDEEHQAAKQVVALFPYFMPLFEKTDTLTLGAVNKFKQNVRNSIPFLYEAYKQKADKYVEANLYYLGAQAAFPEGTAPQQAIENLKMKLNQNPTYRKAERWAKENQASDVQFLPWFSFIDAMYGQIVAITTGFISSFSMARVMSQMVKLDGLFNGVNFFVAKFQILFAAWEKEKPDRQRAQFEKEVRTLSHENEQLQKQLVEEKAKLEEAIRKNPVVQEQLETEFNEKTLKPITEKAQQLLEKMEKSQLKLDKLIGVKKMGALEKAWKKPPEYLNDLKIMIPLGLALGIPYELLYFNNYTDIPLDFFSMKFLYFMGYGTALHAISNTIVKQIIHMTQDRKKLYQTGAKDEMISQNTHQFLANLRGAIEQLEKSEEPILKQTAEKLKTLYQQVGEPLIGDTDQQSGTEKAQNREAKLEYSMRMVEEIRQARATLRQHKHSVSSQELKAAKAFDKYLKTLETIHDKLAYLPRDRSRFELEVLDERYDRDFVGLSGAKNLPIFFHQFFKRTTVNSVQYLNELEEKYPKAELLFEPLRLNAKHQSKQLETLFNQGLQNSSALLTDLKHDLNRADLNRPEVKDATAALKSTRKGFKKNLFYLKAKTKDQADQEMQAFRVQMSQLLKTLETTPMGLDKLEKQSKLVGMGVSYAGKKASYLNKYNHWFSGYPWIPAHSLLNVAGRFGTASIVLEQILPAKVLAMIWLTNHIPIRIIAFGSEKFLVLRDVQHRDKTRLVRIMDKGMETYVKTLIEENKKRAQEAGEPAD